MSHTRTHTVIEFANPYLVCLICKGPVSAWHDNDACGCDDTWWNQPCGHVAGVIGTCYSWNPVDGCTCTGPQRVREG